MTNLMRYQPLVIIIWIMMRPLTLRVHCYSVKSPPLVQPPTHRNIIYRNIIVYCEYDIGVDKAFDSSHLNANDAIGMTFHSSLSAGDHRDVIYATNIGLVGVID